MASTLLSKLWTKMSHKKPAKTVMLVGLDNSGKTSIINRFITLINKQKAAFEDNYSNDDDNEFIVYLPTSNLERSYLEFQLSSSNIMPTAGYNYEKVQYKDTTFTVLDFSGQSRYRNLWQEFYNSVDAIIFVLDSSDTIRFVVARDELENMLNHPYFTTLDNYSPQIKQQQQQSSSSSALVVQNPAIAVQKQITISQGKLIQSPLDASSGSGNGSNLSSEQRRKIRTKVPILFMANKIDLSSSVSTEVIGKALNLSQLSTSRHPWHIQATSVCASQGIFEGFEWLLSQFNN